MLVQNLMLQADGGRLVARRLVLPFLVSVVLHLFVLFQINWDGLRAGTYKLHSLTVSLIPDSLPEPDRMPVSQSTAGYAAAVMETNESDYRIDMDMIRNQAREYAKQGSGNSAQAMPLYGEYYGTYSGDDSGVFSVHLDADGQATGSGESTAYGIVFLIRGHISAKGDISMIGSGKGANASLSGNLNFKTGKISGHWIVPGIAQGKFSGQREQLSPFG